ncbi:MAG TPA: DUF1080 domain-containing protein [Chitinophagaceae bacterium]
MKKKVFMLSTALMMTMLLYAQLPALSKKEQKQGWQLLFDGTSSTGWKKADGKPFPAKGWIIDNGVIQVDTSKGGRGGDIITEESFSDFELTLEFRVTEGANSGIKYFVFPNSSLGCEFQILDDEKHPDAKLGKNGNRKQGGLYDLIAPAAGKKDKPIGEWNSLRIVSKGKHVEHWLNGTKVVEYERGGAAFSELVAGSKYKNNKGFGEAAASPILLQDHGDIVAFRNIKIRKL